MFESLSHYLLFLFSLPFFQSFSSVTKYPPLYNMSCFSHGCKQFPLEKKPLEYKQYRAWQEIQQLVVSVPWGEKRSRFCHF